MTLEPERRRQIWYASGLVGLAAFITVAALASLSEALESNLGPLEGLPMTRSGEIIPEPPLRVVLVGGPASSGHGPIDLRREHETWKQLISVPAIEVTVVGVAHLPTERSQADVVVVPWLPRLTGEAITRLEQFVTSGGGVLAAGPLGESRERPIDMPTDLSRRLVDQHPSPLKALFAVRKAETSSSQRETPVVTGLETRALARGRLGEATPVPSSPPDSVRLVPAPDSLFAHTLPAGHLLRCTREAFEQIGAFVADEPIAFWDRERPEQEERGAPLAAAAINSPGEGRAIWLGFALSQMSAGRAFVGHQQRQLVSFLRWAGRRPVATLDPWPDGQRSRVSLAVSVDDRGGTLTLEAMLRERGLEATWFVPLQWMEDRPGWVERLGRSGEIAVQEERALSQAGMVAQRTRLLRSAAIYRELVGQDALGYRAVGEGDARSVREALALVGFDYLLSERSLGRSLPMWWGTGSRRLAIVPSPLLDFSSSTPPADEVGMLATDRLERKLLSVAPGNWTLLHLATSSLEIRPAVAQTEALLDLLSDRARFSVVPVGQSVQRWKSLQQVKVRCETLRRARVHLTVTGGQKALDRVSITLYLNVSTESIRIDSHHLRPARIVTHRIRPGVFRLEFDRLDARRVQHFFVEPGALAARQ